MARVATLALLVVLLLITGAAAAPLDPVYRWTAGASDSAAQAQATAMAGPLAEGSPFIASADLDLLGDINGDGKSDILYTEARFDGENYTRELRALSGADLKTTLWTLLPPEDQGIYPAFDLDSDGVVDLIGSDFTGRLTLQGLAPVPVPGLSAYEFGYKFGGDDSIFSGKTGKEIGKFVDDSSATVRAVSGSGGGASGIGQVSESASKSWDFYSGGNFLLSEHTSKSVYWRASAQGQRASATTYEPDGIFRLTDVAGTIRARFDVVGPEKIPEAATSLARIGADSLLAVAWRETVAAGVNTIAPAHPSRLHTTAVAGSAALWEVVSAPGLYVEVEAVALVDLTGDGITELQILEIMIDPTAASFVRADNVIRNGATGAEIARSSSNTAVKIYLPFGDLEADGKPELLWAEFGLEDDDNAKFGVATADLKSLWQSTTSGSPVNFASSQDDEELSGLLDWTGDGAPDIVLEDDVGLVLLDGKTGAEIWRRAHGDDEDYFLVGDATGVGNGDFVVVQVTGTVEVEDGPDDGSKTVVVLEFIAGETGKSVRKQILRSPETLAAGPAGAWAWVTGAGDVDGDGRAEFAVTVYDREIIEEEVDGEVERYTRSQPTTYLFSMVKDKPLLTVGNRLPVSGAGSVGLPSPEGSLDTDGVSGKQGSPMSPMGLLLIGLAAIAMRRRR